MLSNMIFQQGGAVCDCCLGLCWWLWLPRGDAAERSARDEASPCADVVSGKREPAAQLEAQEK